MMRLVSAAVVLCLATLGCEFTREAGWISLDVPPWTSDGLYLVGSDDCATTQAFRPLLHESVPPSFTGDVGYRDVSSLGAAALRLPVPFFVVVKKGQIVDVHAGVVHPDNAFASEANGKIVRMLLTRDGFLEGDPWQLLPDKVHRRPHRFQGTHTAFRRFDGEYLGTHKFHDTIVSQSSFRGVDFGDATFERAIFAHVDLRGALLPDGVLANPERALFFNCLCPNGTRSSSSLRCSP